MASTIPEESFPELPKFLHDTISINAASNLQSGFKKCELSLLNNEKPLAYLPTSTRSESSLVEEAIPMLKDSYISVLKSMRYGDLEKSQ